MSTITATQHTNLRHYGSVLGRQHMALHVIGFTEHTKTTESAQQLTEFCDFLRAQGIKAFPHEMYSSLKVELPSSASDIDALEKIEVQHAAWLAR